MKLFQRLKQAVQQLKASYDQRCLEEALGLSYLNQIDWDMDTWPMSTHYFGKLSMFYQIGLKHPKLLQQFEKRMTGRAIPETLVEYLHTFNKELGSPLTLTEEVSTSPLHVIRVMHELSCVHLTKAVAEQALTNEDQPYRVAGLVKHHEEQRYYPSRRALHNVAADLGYNYDSSSGWLFNLFSSVFFVIFAGGALLFSKQLLVHLAQNSFFLMPYYVIGFAAVISGMVMTANRLITAYRERKDLSQVDSLVVLNYILNSVPSTWEEVATSQSTGAAYVRATTAKHGVHRIKEMNPKVACLYGMLQFLVWKEGKTIDEYGYITHRK